MSIPCFSNHFRCTFAALKLGPCQATSHETRWRKSGAHWYNDFWSNLWSAREWQIGCQRRGSKLACRCVTTIHQTSDTVYFAVALALIVEVIVNDLSVYSAWLLIPRVLHAYSEAVMSPTKCVVDKWQHPEKWTVTLQLMLNVFEDLMKLPKFCQKSKK